MTVLNGIGWKGRGSSNSSPSTVTVAFDVCQSNVASTTKVCGPFTVLSVRSGVWPSSIFHLRTKSPFASYARTLKRDPGATLDDIREAVTTLEDAERIARRVLGGAHPITTAIEDDLREALAARETPGSG